MDRANYFRRFLMLLLLITAYIGNYSLVYAAQPSPTSAQIKWQPWSNTLFDQSKQTHHLIFLYTKSKWCHWCQQMDTETFKDTPLINLINTNFIPVQIDIDKNSDVALLYNIVNLPSIIILDADNKTVKTFAGFFPSDKLKNYLQELITNTPTTNLKR